MKGCLFIKQLSIFISFLLILSPALAEEQGNIIVKRASLIVEAINVKNPYVHNVPEAILYVRNNGSISAVIINATLTYGTQEAVPEVVPSAVPSGYISMFSFKFNSKLDCNSLNSPITLDFSIYYYATRDEIDQLTYSSQFTPQDPYADILITPDLAWTVTRDASGSHYSAQSQYSMQVGMDYSLSYPLSNRGKEDLIYRVNVSYDSSYLFIISSTPEASYQRSELATTNFSLSGGSAIAWKHTIIPIASGTTSVKIKTQDLTDGGCSNLDKEINFDVSASVQPGPFGIYITGELNEVDFLLILLLSIIIFVKFYKKGRI